MTSTDYLANVNVALYAITDVSYYIISVCAITHIEHALCAVVCERKKTISISIHILSNCSLPAF